jgi:hypothetical protein
LLLAATLVRAQFFAPPRLAPPHFRQSVQNEQKYVRFVVLSVLSKTPLPYFLLFTPYLRDSASLVPGGTLSWYSAAPPELYKKIRNTYPGFSHPGLLFARRSAA